MHLLVETMEDLLYQVEKYFIFISCIRYPEKLFKEKIVNFRARFTLIRLIKISPLVKEVRVK